MKKLLYSLLLIFFFISNGYSQADDQIILRKVIKTSPISLAFGNFNVRFEQAFDTQSSFQIGLNYWFKIFGSDVSAFGVNGEYRYFISHETKPAPAGFYVGPTALASFINEKDTDASVTIIGIGGTIGYQWIWNSRVTLDVGAGPSYTFVIAEDDGASADFSGFLPRIIIAVGYNF